MTENWAIAIIGFALTVMTAFLGWMATALWGINKSLRDFVTNAECKDRMGNHCDEINRLRDIAEENQQKIAAIENTIKIKHGVDLR